MKKNDVIKVKVKSSSKGELIEEVIKELPVGRGYVHKALDKSFLEHGVGDSYKLELSVNEAYGPRQRSLIKMISAKYFRANNVRPVKGLVVNVDGLMGKVVSASPGRVMVDFNHPLAGKDVSFEVKILELVKDDLAKVRVVVNSFIGQELIVKREGESILIKDTIGLPENIKNRVETELVSVLGKSVAGSIKYISEK